jgi:MYXO-CTERM domain-containing protein
VVDDGEECDDGAANSDTAADACRTTCVHAYCGDGVEDSAEACDDGNNASGDGCSASCALEGSCGDGVIDAEEECDDGNYADGDGCDGSCEIEAGFSCAEKPSVCAEIPSGCGDGVVDADEECDDGNYADGDGCSAACEIEQAQAGDSGCGCASGGPTIPSAVLVVLLTLLLALRRRDRCNRMTSSE